MECWQLSFEFPRFYSFYMLLFYVCVFALNRQSCILAFQDNYTAPRMVLAASGVEHEEFLSIAEPLLSDLPSTKRFEEPSSVYVGGDYRRQADIGVCITPSSSLTIFFSFTTPGNLFVFFIFFMD